MRPLIGKGGDKLLAELIDLDVDAVPGSRLNDRRREVFLRDGLPTLKPTRGARTLLKTMSESGIRVIVATSASCEELGALLRQAGIDDLIEQTATSSDAHESKPDPDIMHAALAKSGLGATQVLMLGDAPYDIQAASTAGVGTIALRCGGWWDDHALSNAAGLFDDPADLLRAIRSAD